MRSIDVNGSIHLADTVGKPRHDAPGEDAGFGGALEDRFVPSEIPDLDIYSRAAWRADHVPPPDVSGGGKQGAGRKIPAPTQDNAEPRATASIRIGRHRFSIVVPGRGRRPASPPSR